ncbi:MAG: hypothetical protein OXI30_04950 [Chloroflexota bacterium]|nr:hypothetical protein [Chloroflexota bacterium]
MRTIAEILRRLSQEQEISEASKDMVAMLVFCLRGIDSTVEESMVAWEKRGYWKKSDEFQQKWWWASRLSKSLETLLRNEDWEKLPETMMQIYGYVADLKVNRLTRDPDAWRGAYQKLVAEKRASSS